METVANYYAQKARIEINDEYLERIDERDLGLMRKAFGYVVIAPFASVAVMYAAKLATHDFSLSWNFV